MALTIIEDYKTEWYIGKNGVLNKCLEAAKKKKSLKKTLLPQWNNTMVNNRVKQKTVCNKL